MPRAESFLREGQKRRRRRRRRPAPRTQPGPYTNRERRKVRTFKKTAKYRGAVRDAYASRPLPQRKRRLLAVRFRGKTDRFGRRVSGASPKRHTHDKILTKFSADRQRGDKAARKRARFTGMSDADRRRAQKAYRTDYFRGAYVEGMLARRRDQERRHMARFTGMSNRERQVVRQWRVQTPEYRRKVVDEETRKVMESPRLLPGTVPGLRASQAGDKVKPGPAIRAAGALAVQNATNRVLKDSADAGLSEREITENLRKLQKENKSPALKILEQFTRPSSAVAGAARAVKEGRNPITAAGRGFVRNDERWARVIGGNRPSAGQEAAGLALDIATDPLTYLTLGTAAPAMQSARAARAGALASKQGMDDAVRAAIRAYEADPRKRRGLQIGLRGTPVRLASLIRQSLRPSTRGAGPQAAVRRVTQRQADEPRRYAVREAATQTRLGQAWQRSTRQVHTSGRATSAVSGAAQAPLRAVGRRLPEGIRRRLDAAAQELGYSYRPRHIDPVIHDMVRAFGREFRASVGFAERAALKRAQAYEAYFKREKIDPESQTRIFDALEDFERVDDLLDAPGLTAKERQAAAWIRRDFDEAHAAEVASGGREAGQYIGARPPRDVPAAPDVAASRKELQKVRRAAASAERQVRKAQDEVARMTGRAEILTRNVTGRQAEAVVRRAIREGTVPPAGAQGLRQAADDLQQAIARRDEAVERLAAHTTRHQEVVQTAKELRSMRRYEDVKAGEAQGYAPRMPVERLEAIEGRQFGTTNRMGATAMGRTIGASSTKRRENRQRIADMKPEDQDRWVRDRLAPVIADRIGQSYRIQHLAQFHNKLGSLGIRLENYDDIAKLARAPLDDEAMQLASTFIRSPKGWQPVFRPGPGANLDKAKAKAQRAIDSGKEVRIVPAHVMDYAWEQAWRGRRPMAASGHVGGLFDEVQGFVKTWQTLPNPGYHFTNLIGDAFNGRLHGLTAADVANGMRLLLKERRIEGYPIIPRSLAPGEKAKAAVDGFYFDLARGLMTETTPAQLKYGGRREFYRGAKGYLTDSEVIHLARESGAINMGFAPNELRQLTQGQARRMTRGMYSPLYDWIADANQAREDLIRLSSFRSLLKRGHDPEDAARIVNQHHFDYGDLTDLEVTFMRRVIPFYTFAARNLVLQARSLAASPGRYATVEKVRDTSAQMSGLEEDWAEAMQKYQQRSVPFAVPGFMPGGAKVEGMPVGVTPKLPVMELNLAAALATLDFRELGEEALQRASVLFKLPLEQTLEYDMFFREEVRKYLVPAPTWATHPGAKKLLEMASKSVSMGREEAVVTEIYDRRTGKMVPAWSWRIDKLMRTMPIGNMLNSVMTPGRDRHAGSKMMAFTNWLTGQRRFAIDPTQARVSQLYDELDDLEREIKQLKQRVPHRVGEKWGGKVKRLNDEVKKRQLEIANLEKDAGVLNPSFGHMLKRGKPKPPKKWDSGGASNWKTPAGDGGWSSAWR